MMSKGEDLRGKASEAGCPGCGREIVFCPRCFGVNVVKDGKDGDGQQRFVCRGAGCGKKFIGKPVQRMVELAWGKQLRDVSQNLLAAQISVAVVSRCTGLAESTIRFDRRQREAVGQ